MNCICASGPAASKNDVSHRAPAQRATRETGRPSTRITALSLETPAASRDAPTDGNRQVWVELVMAERAAASGARHLASWGVEHAAKALPPMMDALQIAAAAATDVFRRAAATLATGRAATAPSTALHPFLKSVCIQELHAARVASGLATLAYSLGTKPDAAVGRALDRRFGMTLVATSTAATAGATPPDTRPPADDSTFARVAALGAMAIAAAPGAAESFSDGASPLAAASVLAAILAALRAQEAVADSASESTPPRSPVRWFAADDESSATRVFAVQGSDSVDAWRTNLAFDPVPFEDASLATTAHRGAYAAAQALYPQLLPYVTAHLATGGGARVQFVGHSLGGSVATLLALMFHARGVVPRSALRPVATFGSAAVVCDSSVTGGKGLLAALGLPEDSVRNVVAANDLVPRAFSCEYGSVVALLRRAAPRSFGRHPGFGLGGVSSAVLYTPLGVTYALQPPTAALGPSHPMLPSGAGLYELAEPPYRLGLGGRAANDAGLGSARDALLHLCNSPHPLSMLADPASYGRAGRVSRAHNPSHYTCALAAAHRGQRGVLDSILGTGL